MDRLINKDLQQYSERITRTILFCDYTKGVFDETDNILFNQAVANLRKEGTQVLAGGRSLREAIGVTTTDFAEDIRTDAILLPDTTKLRMGELYPYLERYPARMKKPDLDFFTQNTNPQNIVDLMRRNGLKANLHMASGGVRVAVVQGSNGMATFTDYDDSFQTKGVWPIIGFTAPICDEEGVPVVKINISSARIYEYPLTIPEIHRLNPTDPNRFAAVSRGLLWGVVLNDPEGKPLKVPDHETQKAMIETVGSVPHLLEQLSSGEKDRINYRGALRDMALALRLILYNHKIYSNSTSSDFYSRIAATFNGSRFCETQNQAKA